MSPVRPSEMLWKESGGYYTDTAAELRLHPMLPDLRRLRDRRIARLFDRYGNLQRAARVLEVGCGRSAWLPYLAQRWGCTVAGIDIEPFAAELAVANLAGAGTAGTVWCRDAFAPEESADLCGQFDLIYSMGLIEHFDDPVPRLQMLAAYLRPGGRILTMVPNLRGVNGFLQRFVDPERFQMHVIYNATFLTRIHEAAGLVTLGTGYVGFYDGFLTSPGPRCDQRRQAIHRWICRASNMGAEAWTRVAGDLATPELPWLAPHVFYAGHRLEGAA